MSMSQEEADYMTSVEVHEKNMPIITETIQQQALAAPACIIICFTFIVSP